MNYSTEFFVLVPRRGFVILVTNPTTGTIAHVAANDAGGDALCGAHPTAPARLARCVTAGAGACAACLCLSFLRQALDVEIY